MYLTKKLDQTTINEAKKNDAVIGASQNLITNKKLVDKIHRAGVEIDAWTVDSEDRKKELNKMNVDYITTNTVK